MCECRSNMKGNTEEVRQQKTKIDVSDDDGEKTTTTDDLTMSKSHLGIYFAYSHLKKNEKVHVGMWN